MTSEDARAEAPEWPDERRRCFWRVDDFTAGGSRACGNPGSNYYGPDLAFCAVHDKKFYTTIMRELEENPQFRAQMIRHIGESERDEAALWAEHRREIREWSADPGRAHCVYFAERDGFVKIGRTSNLKKRMHDIGKGSCMPQGMSVGPVRLLAVIHCGCTSRGCVRERHFHRQFRAKWLEGEWFLLDRELSSFIGGLQECLDDHLREVSGDAPAA